jgi:hypothetical protein
MTSRQANFQEDTHFRIMRILQEKKILKHRQAIEPIIGHLKVDHRMNRCNLKGSLGDSLHEVLRCGLQHLLVAMHDHQNRSGPFIAAAAGSGFDRFAAQIASDLHRQPGQFRLDQLGDGLKVNFSGTTN